MIKLALRLFTLSLVFRYLMPDIPGIFFQGHLNNAMLMAALFSILFWTLDSLVGLISSIIAVSTFGLALLWLVPLWIFGFWIIPSAALLMVANFMPENLRISGCLPAMAGGVILLCINLIVGRLLK